MTNAQAHCTYIMLDNHIHKLVVLKADRRGADEGLGFMRSAFDAHVWGSEQIFRLIVDLRPDGMPPIAYALPRIMRLVSEYDTSLIRIAYLINNNVLVTTLYTLVNMLKIQSTRRVFEGDAPEVDQQAIAWLLDTPNRTPQGEEANAL